MGKSWGKFSELDAARIARLQRAEMQSFRQHFAAVWSDFVRAHFASPADAAAFFAVDPSTAENWWQGLNAPQGWVVGRAMSDPDLGGRLVRAMGDARARAA